MPALRLALQSPVLSMRGQIGARTLAWELVLM
jgi:hypothetical protein